MAIIESAYSNEVSATPVEVSGPTHIFAVQGINLIRYEISTGTWDTIANLGATYKMIAVDDDADYIFVTGDSRPIKRLRRDGTNPVDIIASNAGASTLSLDRTRQELFYSASSQLRRANYDGSGVTSIVSYATSSFFYDQESDWLYFLRATVMEVLRRVRRDGSVNESVISLGTSASTGQIAMDVPGNRVFITRGNLSLIWEVDVDAVAVSTFVTGSTIQGIAWDSVGGYLYRVSGSSVPYSLFRTNSDGSSSVNLGQIGDGSACGGIALSVL
jgi:hypothetical protein